MFPHTHTPTPCMTLEEISGMRSSSGKTGAFRQLVPAVSAVAGALQGVLRGMGDKLEGLFFPPSIILPTCASFVCPVPLSEW